MKPKKSLYLITSSDERTWKFDRPVIFLGEWCLLNDRKHIWQNMDAIVAEPYGVGLARKDADYAEARTIEEKLFPEFCSVLNNYHDRQYSLRFWRIVIGHWFRRYVDVMLNRVKALEQCLQSYYISGTTVYAADRYILATPNSYSAIWAFNDERWNNALTSRILDQLVLNWSPEVIDDFSASGFQFGALPSAHIPQKTVFRRIYQQVRKLARCLVRDTDVFIHNSYLPRDEEIKLQLALCQVPQLWVSTKLAETEKPDKRIRKSLTSQFEIRSGNLLESTIRVMLFELLPTCYLEAFSDLERLVKKQSWPRKPRMIFTSNSFDTDEVFKLWTANHVETGIKYITGQHGNNYGTFRYMYPSIEEATADYFLTWGWTDGLSQHTPAFVFKTAGRKIGHYNQKGGLLLIEQCHGGRVNTWDRCHEFEHYFQDQLTLVKKLAKAPYASLTIRLQQPYNYPLGSEISRWQALDDSLKLEFTMNIGELVSMNRLVVHSYDSTGILETLALNIPTLAFWQNGFDHLRESAKPYYQLLVDAGIVHLSPQSTAEKINEVWGDVNAWWSQNKVQDARSQFCERYARQSKKPVRDFKLILSKI
jgi:putative transferase (TIGR04331 family)